VVDVSASLWFDGSISKTIRPIDFAFELALFIAASALARQMTVDLMLISDHVELHFEHLQGREKLNRLISELTAFQPRHRNTHWDNLSASFQRVRPGSYLFWISDFLWLPEPVKFSEDFSQFIFQGIAIEGPTQTDNDDSALNYDFETGGLITDTKALSPLKSIQRINQWSHESGMPILQISTESDRPELLISHWLRRFSGDSGQ
jgi:hypothetical protein